MNELVIFDVFDKVILIPNLNEKEIINILSNYKCSSIEKEKISSFLKEIPIKRLYYLIDNVLQKESTLTFKSFKDEYNEIKKK